MSKRTKAGPPPKVGELLNQITAWRRKETKPRPIPEEFWSAATQLGREYGVSLVSRHLKLDFHGLKRRVLSGKDTAITKSGGFVEFQCVDMPGMLPHNSGFVTEVEIFKPGKATVRVRQSGPSGIDIVGMIERCLGRI